MGAVEINEVSQKFILIFFRIASVLWLLPIFSARAVSAMYKAGLSLLIAFLLFDLVVVKETLGGDPFGLMILVVKEVFVGLTIGFFVRVLFLAVNAAGEIASFQSGFSFARFMDPISMSQVTPFEQVKNLLAIMVFLAVDGHHILLKGLSGSFREIPVGTVAMRSALMPFLIDMTGKVFSIGLRIGAPVIVTLFLVELAFGMLSRMIPQVNIFIEGVPVKIFIAVSVLSISLGIITPGIAALFRDLDGQILKIFRYLV